MDKNLQLLLNICAIFGICLVTPKCFGKNGKGILTVYIILLIVTLFLNCIIGIVTNKMVNDYIISWMVATSVFISQMFTHFVIMSEALGKQQEHSDFLHLLQEIEDSFAILLKLDVRSTKISSQFKRQFIVMMVISKACLFIYGLNVFVYADPGYFYWALMAILAMRFRFVQLIVYVEILKFYIKALNLKLQQVVFLKMESSKQIMDVDYRSLKSIDILRNIKHIYASIYEASNLMNEFAQASLFAASASNFLDFTCHIYWTLLAMENLLGIHNVISSVATILPLGLFILKFCHSSQIIKEEGERCSLLLSRLMCSEICPAISKAYKDLVHDFSLQLMHQRIVFTGKRCFNFDLQCIFGILALIATHLIILIQFTKNDSSQRNNTNIETN